MDAATVAQLSTPQGREALELAAQQADPGSLAAAQTLRARFGADLAAAALTQADLRRRGATKFGASAAELFFTRDGLEQATRPEVAARHAARFRAAGVQRVVDLGCGVGSDALAFLDADIAVTAVEIDPQTAEIARLNLGDRAEVVVGDAEAMAGDLLGPGVGVFCDPARRTTSGRLWRVEDFTPSWSFVTALLERAADLGLVGVKLGPALPHSLVSDAAEAEWVSHRGDTVEVGLWAGTGTTAGARVALVLPDHRLVVAQPPPPLDVGDPARYVYEPVGAVIRAGGVTTVGALVGGALLDPRIAYLTSDLLVDTPFARAFEVLDVLPYKEKALRQWLRAHRVGRLEIKKRGLEGDPAQLRKRLALAGPESATLIMTRTPKGAIALITRRV
jgi:SAM-dependent methyltransferase